MTAAAISSRGRNLALLAALLGWMFDGMEMGLFPLVGRTRSATLLSSCYGPRDARPESHRRSWYGIVTRLLPGRRGDRRRALRLARRQDRPRPGHDRQHPDLLTLQRAQRRSEPSANSLALCASSGALGMGGEWTLGVALVMEVWPNASRGWLAGWIGAFGNLGYTICGGIAWR